MRGLWYVLFLVLGTGLVVTACDRDEESGGLATAPSLASASGNGPCGENTLTALVRNAFSGGTTRNSVSTYAVNLAAAFDGNKKGKATWWGFQILQAIDTAPRPANLLTGKSNLAVATLGCMTLGTVTVPASLEAELGDHGAFGVRGRSTADRDAVVSRDGDWIMEPPATKTWKDITTLTARTDITADTARLFLALGKPGSGAGFAGSGDELVVGSFNWSTLPKATFDEPYVVIGQCSVGDGFLQHFSFDNASAEIFTFVEPTQCPGAVTMLEPAPRTFAQRLFRALTPAPAFASALIGRVGGGAKPGLSPFGIVKPGKVNLSTFSVSPSKKQQTRGVEFSPVPAIRPTSAGGVAFKQTSVLTYLTPVVNLGTPGFICYNWAYNDEDGVTDFPHAFYTKAGGLNLLAKTVGTLGTAASTGEAVPVVAAGANAVSAAMNVKNSATVISVCPVFDGSTYFTNILDPNAQQIAFDPTDEDTFPPNYDEVSFP